ncbi:MAG TPA: Holliday junction branch migration protein RuvA [Candidatus Dormibacteraeota bacterium]|nr:Holliday junction branch migration protein RuvA [Candidatus Dormibacteraeota bacterium]
MLAERGDEKALVEVAGLSYEVLLPPCVAEKLRGGEGRPVTLEVYSQLQTDGNAGRFVFFGFTNAIEREFFEALLTVASIGPKSACRAFNAPMHRIARAIDEGNHTFLRSLPGIGQQKAKDIVAKLQGKVARFLLIQEAEPVEVPPPTPDFAQEALAVLLQLEYKKAESERMIAQTLEASPEIRDAEALLAEIYRRQKAVTT